MKATVSAFDARRAPSATLVVCRLKQRPSENGHLTTARSCRGPTSVRRPSRLLFRQRDAVTAVAVRHSLHRSSLAATAAPLRLRHAGPGRAAQAIDVRRTETRVYRKRTLARCELSFAEAAEVPRPCRRSRRFGAPACRVRMSRNASERQGGDVARVNVDDQS